MAPQRAVELLDRLTKLGIVTSEQMAKAKAMSLSSAALDLGTITDRLIKAGFLTVHQGESVRKNQPEDLIYGAYVREYCIGQGGMGTVYKARHISFNRPAVLKTIQASLFGEKEARVRFLREVAITGKVMHTNIVTAHDAGERGGELYLAMEYVEGSNLNERIKEKGPFTWNQACCCLAQAAEGLAHAHAKGIIHRDIKPANIMVTDDGVVKVLDLGLARMSESFETVTQGWVGTVDFSSPEQADDASKVDERSDIYSLGCTLYYLIAGQSPYADIKGMQARLFAHASKPAPELPLAPKKLQKIYHQMMEKKPGDRPQTMEDVADRLADLVLISQTDPGSGGRNRRLREPLIQPKSASVIPETNPNQNIIFIPPTRPDWENKLQSQWNENESLDETVAANANPPRSALTKRKWLALTVCAAALLIMAAALWVTVKNFSQPTQPPAPVPSQPPVPFAKTFGIQLIDIPKGEFFMGSEDGFADERPVHKVKISQFGMSAHEITRGQFAKFVEDTQYKTEAETNGKGGYLYDEAKGGFRRDPAANWKNPGFTQTDDHPVVNVSWKDAKKFTQWLSAKDGRQFQLPSEAQWEYACRAGSTTKYHFGKDEEDLPKYANIAEKEEGDDGYVFSAPVGQFRANSFGLYDMHGNVWEWCEDWYDPEYYDKTDVTDPVNAVGPTLSQVLRGGGWNSEASFARSASRYRFDVSETYHFIGFRVVTSVRKP